MGLLGQGLRQGREARGVREDHRRLEVALAEGRGAEPKAGAVRGGGRAHGLARGRRRFVFLFKRVAKKGGRRLTNRRFLWKGGLAEEKNNTQHLPLPNLQLLFQTHVQSPNLIRQPTSSGVGTRLLLNLPFDREYGHIFHNHHPIKMASVRISPWVKTRSREGSNKPPSLMESAGLPPD